MPLLISCRQGNGGFPQRTTSNARSLVEGLLPRLSRPAFSLGLWQVRFATRSPQGRPDLLDFISIYETDDPQLDPGDCKFVLEWSSRSGWRIMSQEDFDYIVGTA